MRKRLPWKWEQLDGHTWRAKVIGGWIVKLESATESVTSLFIEDKDHDWSIAADPLPIEEIKENNIPYCLKG